MAINQNAATCGIIKARQKINQSGFTGATMANDGDDLALLDFQIYATENLSPRSFIFKRDIVINYLVVKAFNLDRIRFFYYVRFFVKQGKNPLS
ncbi:MAG: hypothetical protein BWX60_00725 [Candidatus Marinimicrobia bacterium ADurb.Bin030]|nr:MAG: hypothetical protein BWX60_00725 [Candidatus Marinimicrobia bacterium ADurb.Bin030]